MNTETGKQFFSIINKRAMEISRKQGATKGLARGSKIQAAREIFARHGSPGGDFDAWWGEVHKHGTSISSDPDAVRRRQARQKEAAKQTAETNVSPAVVARYISYINEHDGIVPLDWQLLREWTDVTATDLRRARKVILSQGYEQNAKSSGHYVFTPPLSPEPTERPTYNIPADVEQTRNHEANSDAAVLDDISAKLDWVISLLRELCDITNALWK